MFSVYEVILLCFIASFSKLALGYFRKLRSSGPEKPSTLDKPTTEKTKIFLDSWFNPPLHKPGAVVTLAQELQIYKDLYFKLQHLEQHSSVLLQSRDLLISFLAEALSKATSQSEKGIQSIREFSPKSLASFLQEKDKHLLARWEQYLERRRGGAGRELFQDQEHAKWWLRQSAPVKYVDGAWLGHIHKVTTPFPLRRITKNAWQIMSEELGDGDLAKHHVHIYRELMGDIKSELPDGDSLDFINSRHDLNEPGPWKAAVAQLLISLFPHEFLPEILGFNMHFEMLTWDTMRAIKELKELKIDDYYFLLHISIDNADSGHTAIAYQTVVDYITYIKQTNGKSAADQAWRRVQAGFALSETLPSSPQAQVSSNPYDSQIIEIFKAKAAVAHKLHCGSRVRLKNRSLVDWLEPQAFESKEWQKDFLHALSNSTPWVYKGDSARSKLLHELSWNGKMFGSFTQTEVETVKNWVDAFGVPVPDPNIYWKFTGRKVVPSHEALASKDIASAYPVLVPSSLPPTPALVSPPTISELLAPCKITAAIDHAKFLPLWFAHPCLLESIITIPFKTANTSSAAVLTVLRAQYGFATEGTGVAGMDEVRGVNHIGVHELGLEMMARAQMAKPESLQDVFHGRDSDFATEMLQWSMRPLQHHDLLLGMAWAFVTLHDAVATSATTSLLSQESKIILANIAERERCGLKVCLDQLMGELDRYAEFYYGFTIARGEIKKCFEEVEEVEEV